MLEAVIFAKFRKGPGSEKVLSGDFELFSSYDASHIVNATTIQSTGLIPGMRISMAIVVGQYATIEGSTRCARTACKSRSFQDAEQGGKTWYVPIQTARLAFFLPKLVLFVKLGSIVPARNYVDHFDLPTMLISGDLLKYVHMRPSYQASSIRALRHSYPSHTNVKIPSVPSLRFLLLKAQQGANITRIFESIFPNFHH